MMRDKRRYILVRSTMRVDERSRRDFELELYRELLREMGEINYPKANPRIMKFVSEDTFILKCGLVKYSDTIIALAFIKRMSGKEIGLYTLGASGTIRALMKPS